MTPTTSGRQPSVRAKRRVFTLGACSAPAGRRFAKPKENQDHRDRELEAEPDPRRNRDAEEDNCAADHDDRQRMADSPERADARGAAEAPFARDDGR